MEPLFLTVRLHPNLLTDSRDYELSKERWARHETHDFLASLQKIAIAANIDQCDDGV